MLFNSLHFLAFLPLVLVGFHVLGPRHRWVLLLAASYYFYMAWRPEYALLLLASTVVDYLAARAMGGLDSRLRRAPFLLASLAVNLGLLFTFKYWGFFASNANAVLDAAGTTRRLPLLDLLLPIGISFYTFQTLGYSIDVFRGQVRPERHFGRFALYVSFFPQLVAGPIERASSLLPQLRALRAGWDAERLIGGCQKILWGFFKKLVIADRLAQHVDACFATPAEASSAALLVAVYFFAIQIYCDFSGYSDIAIGTARLFGVDLMENFRYPYFAANVRDFWSRWHVSLSTWFRDYVYLPLGGNRGSQARTAVNLALVFLVSGLWHGASWTFVAWGAFHAAFLLWHRYPWRLLRSRLPELGAVGQRCGRAFSVLLTFHLVVLAFLVFRAASVGEAWRILCRLISPAALDVAAAPSAGSSLFGLALAAALIALLITVEALIASGRGACWRSPALRPVLAGACLAAILTLGVFEGQQFIYFQF